MYFAQAALLTFVSLADNRFGSNDGLVASARIRPVDGSIATTAPRYFFRPWYAARCAAAFSVSSTDPPLRACPRSRSENWLPSSRVSVPDRIGSSARSMPVAP